MQFEKEGNMIKIFSLNGIFPEFILHLFYKHWDNFRTENPVRKKAVNSTVQHEC